MCCSVVRLRSPFRETFSYGNILETPLTEVWNNELFQRNRSLAKQNIAPNPTCESCDRYSKVFFAPRTEDTIALV